MGAIGDMSLCLGMEKAFMGSRTVVNIQNECIDGFVIRGGADQVVVVLETQGYVVANEKQTQVHLELEYHLVEQTACKTQKVAGKPKRQK